MKRSEKLIFGVGASYLYFAVNVLISFFLIPVMIRFLGRTGYGTWMTILSVIGYLGISEYGVVFSVSKFVSEYYARKRPSDLNKAISTSFIIFSGLGLLAFAGILVISIFFADFLGLTSGLARAAFIALIIAGLNLAFTFPLNVLSSIIFGQHKIAEFNLINIFSIVINAVLVIVFLKLGYGIIGIASVLLITTLCVAMVRMAFIKASFKGISLGLGKFDRRMFKRIVSFSFFIFMMGVGTQIVFNTNNIVIAKILGVGMVAAYAIAFRLNQFAMAFINKLSEAFFPFFTELKVIGDTDKLKEYFYESTKLSVALAVPIVLILVFWGEQLISLWVGPENCVGRPVLYLMAGVTLLSSIIHPAALVLQGAGKVKAMVGFNLLEACLNLGLTIILVMHFGVFGAALGTLAAMAATNSWYIPLRACLEVGASKRYFIYDSVFKPLAAGVMMMLMAYFIEVLLKNNNLFFLGLKSLIIMMFYAVIFLMFGVKRDKRALYMDKLYGAMQFILKKIK